MNRESIFRGKAIGNRGGVPIDRSYILSVNKRAKRLRAACRIKPSTAVKAGGVTDKQQALPFGNKTIK